jgi:hypothetical protein
MVSPRSQARNHIGKAFQRSDNKALYADPHECWMVADHHPICGPRGPQGRNVRVTWIRHPAYLTGPDPHCAHSHVLVRSCPVTTKSSGFLARLNRPRILTYSCCRRDRPWAVNFAMPRAMDYSGVRCERRVIFSLLCRNWVLAVLTAPEVANALSRLWLPILRNHLHDCNEDPLDIEIGAWLAFSSIFGLPDGHHDGCRIRNLNCSVQRAEFPPSSITLHVRRVCLAPVILYASVIRSTPSQLEFPAFASNSSSFRLLPDTPLVNAGSLNALNHA